MALDDVGVDMGAFTSGQMTDDTRPTLRGTAGPNSVVIIHDGENNPIGSALADTKGDWIFTPDVALSEGTHHLTVVGLTASSAS